MDESVALDPIEEKRRCRQCGAIGSMRVAAGGYVVEAFRGEVPGLCCRTCVRRTPDAATRSWGNLQQYFGQVAQLQAHQEAIYTPVEVDLDIFEPELAR